MNKRKLGRTNLLVSELCLNTTKFGWINDEAVSQTLLDTYHAAGGNFIQSLGFCSHPTSSQAAENNSEDLVGRWHTHRAIPRESLVLASRITFFRPAHGGSIAFANLIREACERSLRRLRSQHLDLLVCDWDEHLVPVSDVLEAVDMLIRAGLVRYVVAGEFPPWRVVDSIHRCGTRNHARFEAVQADYSLITRARFETESLAMCREHRLGLIASSPLAGGFLAQRPVSLRELINLDRSWQNERFGNHFGDAMLRTLSVIADKRFASPAQIALAWVLQNPQVTSALISAPSAKELRDMICVSDITLTTDEMAALASVTTVQDYRMELRHA